jgi:hypothetical protein
MIKWIYKQFDLWTYTFTLMDEFNRPIYLKESEISAPAMPILKEILTDYLFAKKINNIEEIFKFDILSKDDQMELMLASLQKLEDIDEC